MNKQTVDRKQAMQALELTWSSVENTEIFPDPEIARGLEIIIGSRGNIAFKYILITGLLAKYVNCNIHPRALQVNSNLPGAYDARSLCHSVIVRFEKTKGNLFGLSNEPFLSKPARHTQHDKSNPKLKNKRIATVLHDVLETIASSTPQEVFKSLVYTLRLAKERSATIIEAGIDTDPNYSHVIGFVEEFLTQAEGGVRLVAVTGAFLSLLNQNFQVRVYQPNVSDRFARTAGDIEIWNEKTLISATECKHRPLTLDDIRHGIGKAKEYSVPEYCFTFASGLGSDEEASAIKNEIKKTENIDIILINIYEALHPWTSALNPARRSIFGKRLENILRDIRQFDTANTASQLWNNLL